MYLQQLTAQCLNEANGMVSWFFFFFNASSNEANFEF